MVFPLIGFPGLNLTGGTIKLAQQNYGEHYKVVKALADEFKPDAIFPLMDLSVEANALGRLTVFPKKESATVVKDEFSMDELKSFENINIAYDTRLHGYVETMKMMSIGLPKDILRGAYVSGPYTLTALIMGADEAAILTIMNPELLMQVCEVATEKILEYVRLLVASGAQMICVLEPSAVMLGPEQFKQFSADYVGRIVNSLRYSDVAVIYHVCGNSMHLIETMCSSGVDALSLDSSDMGIDLPLAAYKVPDSVIIIGNISPTKNLLRGNPHDIESDVQELLDQMKSFPNYILSSGCDLPQETPVENIHAFMNAGRKYKLQ
ncbi:MAG: uroporphyrinogen decarboxylase family protein [Melioribacteraceae bacterium]|nr:uroporphyrinogen decarboxylase family protein [Melioribacteraceae bacterium]